MKNLIILTLTIFGFMLTSEVRAEDANIQKSGKSENASERQLKSSRRVVLINFFSGTDHDQICELIETFTKENKSNTEIHLVIYSGGGSILKAVSAYNYAKALDLNISTYNLSRVGSAANILFALGEKRYAFERSYFFYHRVSSSTDRTNEFELKAGFRKIAERDIFEISKEAIPKISHEKFRGYMNDSKIIEPKEAMDLGLIHGIVEALPKADKTYNIN